MMLIREVEKPLDIRNPVEKIRILDKGYSWLQIAIDKEYYWLSAFYDDNGQLISIYFDMTDGNIIKGDNAYFTDMFLDYELYQSKAYEIDLAELQQAYELDIINDLQYKRTLEKGKELYAYLKNNSFQLIELCHNRRQELLGIINEEMH